MILGYRSTVPAHLPQKYLLLLIIGNIIIHMYSEHFMVYEVFIYLYGMITLICKKYCDFNKEYHQTVLINIVFVWMDFGTDIKLKENQQFIVFTVVCSVYFRLICDSIRQLWNSIRIGRTVTFSHVFIVIQYVTVNKFIVYFTGMKEICNIPMYIRIIQNLKIMTPKSIRAVLRFLLIIILTYIPNSNLWFFLKIFLSVWQIYNDFKYSFKINRLFEGEFCYFPIKTYLIMFSINIVCRICWIFSPTYTVLMSVMRKLIENYFRLEAQSAQRKQEDFIRAILDMTNIETQDICV